MDDRSVEYVVKENAETTAAARDVLLALLPTIPIPTIGHSTTGMVQSGPNKGKPIRQRSETIGRIGRTCTFGFGKTRTKGYTEFVRNARYPEVMKALVDYGNCVVPTGFFYNTITVNKGVQAKKHTDTLNVGKSIIVSFGPHTGGNLRVYSSETEYEAMDIHDRPLLFNGSLLAHETEPFEGERWSIIYYSQKRNTPLVGYTTVGN
jgi:hypothetical protein